MADAEEVADEKVAVGLLDDTFSGIDQDNGYLRSGSTRHHVSGVLHVSRSIRHDEIGLVGIEIDMRHIDGDALLALGYQPVRG